MSDSDGMSEFAAFLLGMSLLIAFFAGWYMGSQGTDILTSWTSPRPVVQTTQPFTPAIPGPKAYDGSDMNGGNR